MSKTYEVGWLCGIDYVYNVVTKKYLDSLDCAEELNTKDAEIERLQAFADRLADQATQEVSELRSGIESLRKERDEADE